MPFSYFHLVVVFSGAVLFIALTLLLKNPWQAGHRGILGFLNQARLKERERDQEYLVPLLAYEEDYPAFGDILGLVLEKFPLKHFLRQPDFEKSLYYLSNSVFQTADRGDLEAAMCSIVSTFIGDPDVEYHCRPHLRVLVDQFLKEVGRPLSSG